MNNNDIRTSVVAAATTVAMIGALYVWSELNPWGVVTRAWAARQLTDDEREALDQAAAEEHDSMVRASHDRQEQKARRAHSRGKFRPGLFGDITDASALEDLTVTELLAAIDLAKAKEHQRWTWVHDDIPVADETAAPLSQSLAVWTDQLIALRDEFTDRRWMYRPGRRVSAVDRLRLEAADRHVWSVTETTEAEYPDTAAAYFAQLDDVEAALRAVSGARRGTGTGPDTASREEEEI